MSVYHNAFSYLGKNSRDLNWIVTHFSDNADTGETDTFLSTSAIYSESSDGTRRQIHGVKYDKVVEATITVIKQDGTDFGVQDNREALRWLTGSKQATWMDLYMGDEIKYRLLGRVSNVSQYKLDARVVGLIITFESVSPYGYSSSRSVMSQISGTKTLTVNCDSDDLYSYVPMNVKFTNTSTNNSLKITNASSGDITEITSGLLENEVITLSDNMIITSDNPARTFGNTFNYIFPRLVAGENKITVEGTGRIVFEYIAPVKLGNIAIDLNSVSDSICNDSGEIIVDTLDWSRIVNTPNTLAKYGIEDAYTKAQVDAKFKNIDISSIDTYTKTEIDQKINNITSSGIDINEYELNAMLVEVLGE